MFATLAPAESRSSPLTKSMPTREAAIAQGLCGRNLRGDDALGIADAAAVHIVSIFAERDVGRNGIKMSGEDEVGGFAGDRRVDVPAGAR